MRIVFISNLFPDSAQPVRGLDNATILHELRARPGHEIEVIALRPSLTAAFRKSGRSFLPRPSKDEVLHPVFLPVPYIPRVGSRWNDRLMEQVLRPVLEKRIREFKPDLVIASWLYPDGCAVARICRDAGIPCVLITQGSDTHQYLANPIRRRKIVDAIGTSAAVICRSGDLAKRLAAAGVGEEKPRTIYNGIDPDVFFPVDQAEARRSLGLDADEVSLLFVGNLLPVKNPSFLLRAHAEVNESRVRQGKARARLRLIGEGPLRESLIQETRDLGTSGQVEFLGRRTSPEIATWMNASDVFCLTSVNEGFPNVLLEAMACGLPVVSTDVGGISERVGGNPLDRLVVPGDLAGFSRNLLEVLEAPCRNRMAVTRTWSEAAKEYDDLMREAVAAP